MDLFGWKGGKGDKNKSLGGPTPSREKAKGLILASNEAPIRQGVRGRRGKKRIVNLLRRPMKTQKKTKHKKSKKYRRRKSSTNRIGGTQKDATTDAGGNGITFHRKKKKISGQNKGKRTGWEKKI